MSNNVVLVAPRPLRVTAASTAHRSSFSPSARLMSPPADAFTRIKLGDGDQLTQPTEDDSFPSSGRSSASPRLNLPSDALEEFLSILRPSLFPPTSPNSRARRHDSGSALVVPIERPQAFGPRDGSHSKSPSVSSVTAEDGNVVNVASTPSAEMRQYGDNDHLVGSLWRIPGILGMLDIALKGVRLLTLIGSESPVSRTHTRNPFQRHPSYEMAFSSVLTAHLSPSLLPLPPSPSPAPLSLTPPAVQLSASPEEMDT
ncbi:hypothetical protein DFH11DRAFT_1574301 [Phellopilus nigrolimitatus]|nr:hypothetical protein DFH11DRAFT_1574301 [Phellopilus nigrolimitatus]